MVMQRVHIVLGEIAGPTIYAYDLSAGDALRIVLRSLTDNRWIIVRYEYCAKHDNRDNRLLCEWHTLVVERVGFDGREE